MIFKSKSPLPFSHSLIIPTILGIAFFLLIGCAWLTETPTRECLYGETAKMADLANSKCQWTPSYLMGQSEQYAPGAFIAIGIVFLFKALFVSILGPLGSMKLACLMALPLAAVAMGMLLNSMDSPRGLCAWGGLFYMILPPIIVASGIYEHWNVGFCFIFIPLILRGLIVIADKPSPRECVILALSASALALCYIKIAITSIPVILIIAIYSLKNSQKNPWSVVSIYISSLLIACLTSLVLILPSFREFGFAAGFLFDPLDAWKHHYSFKTPLLWIDLWGSLTKGGDGNLIGDAQMFQIGVIPLIGLSLALALPGLAEWRASKLGRWFLILTACWLVGTWFASGPDGILLGHINVLKTAQGLPDTTIPLLWLSVIWIGWLIYRTASQLLPKNALVPALITLIVLLVPVFRIAEFFPFFKDIRAPESFWSVGGFCCLAAAVGMGFWVLFTEVVRKDWVKPLAIIVGVLMLAELYPIHSAYWTRGMDRQIFTEFDQAAAFLKAAPLQGRVHALSARYFFELIPTLTGRPLDTEAQNRHLQMKWVRHLEVAGNASGDAIRTYMNVAGVAYILLDKEDPFSPKQMQDFFRSVYPVVFENKYFAVLANPGTLYPAFLAHDFVVLPKESYAMAPAALQLLPQNLATVEMAGVDQNMPGFAGMAKGPSQIELLQQYQGKAGQPFARVPLVGNRMDDYQRMTYQLPPTASGWLIVSEAYHPDWTVTIDGHPAEVHRAEAALLSTYVPPGSHEVIFQFKAPGWYSLCLTLGALSWIVALAALLYLPSKWAPAKWRAWWVTGKGSNLNGGEE